LLSLHVVDIFVDSVLEAKQLRAAVQSSWALISICDRDETIWRPKPGSLSSREAPPGREPPACRDGCGAGREKGVPNPKVLLSPTLSSLWEEREKKLAFGSSQFENDLEFESGLQFNSRPVRGGASSLKERQRRVMDTP
jgi:hypothetical protein